MESNAQDARPPDHISSLSQERATESNALEIPTISLPNGGGALKGIDGKFEREKRINADFYPVFN